ncbi:MAG: DUF401 family protein [Proteobacteria bacterium]|nr:DUF401 family protein [Pseudomonadota bacterium]MBU1056798.1 DUF401 family protein [Pseudomonadota bacterium]
MNWLIAALPFVKVLGAFLLMLIGVRCKRGLAMSILFGALVMGGLFGLSPLTFVKIGLLALTQEKFLFLLAIIAFILILSDGLEQSGQSKRLMVALSGYLHSPRLRLIFFPALIGLLPMPGGAVFSAPMVKAVSESMEISNKERALINYWFRHVWELAWPLYPGIILTVALADIPLVSFIICTWPGVLMMFFLGWFFFLRPLRPATINMKEAVPSQPADWTLVLKEGLPLLIAIVGAVGLESLLPVVVPGLSFEWGVIAALFLAVFCIMIQNHLGLQFMGSVLRKKSLWTMLAVIAAIFVFKDIMQAAGVVDAMAAAAGDGVALFAAAAFLPFLVGMVAGINVAFVGATFPLLLALLSTLGLSDQVIPYLVLASVFGFTGVMISPLHICFVLTCQFFGVEAARTWRRLVFPCLCFALFGCLLFSILLALPTG